MDIAWNLQDSCTPSRGLYLKAQAQTRGIRSSQESQMKGAVPQPGQHGTRALSPWGIATHAVPRGLAESFLFNHHLNCH